MKDYPALSYASQSESTSRGVQMYTMVMEYKFFFQFFDQIFSYIHFPPIFDNLVFIWLGWQVIFTSLWIPHSNVWNFTDLSQEIINWLNSIINFQSLEKNETNYLYTFFVYLILFLCSLGHLIFQIACSRIRGRLIHSTLYTTKIFVFYVPAITIHPLSILCGNLLDFIFPNGQKQNGNQPRNNLILADLQYIYALFAFTIVFFVYFEVMFYISFRLLSNSAYLPNSLLASFDFFPIIMMITFSSVCQFLAYIMWIFPSWSIYFMIVVHLFLASYAFYKNLRGKLISQTGNALVASVIISCIALDIIRIIMIFLRRPNAYYAMIFTVASLVISFTVSFIVYGIKNKKRLELVNAAIEEYSDTLKREEVRLKIFQDLGMVDSGKKTISFLEFFIIHQKYQFIDFLTIKFVLSKHHSREYIIKLMRMIVQFPCLTSYLNVLSTELATSGEITMFNKFLIYEIQRIKIYRQSSSSAAAVESMKMLTAFGKEIESNIKYFWEQSNIKPQTLCGISNKIYKLQMLWEEEISYFQNSIQHYCDYERFLIECKTDFTSAIYQQYKKELIESGSSFKIDKCYAMFVQLFPEYLKDKIMNISGRFIKGGPKEKNGSSNNSNTANLMSSSTSEIDAALEQTLGKALFAQSRLRIALQNATKHKIAKSSFIMCYGIFVTFILSLGLSLFIYLFYRSSLDNRSQTSERIELASNIRFYSFLTGLSLIYDLFGVKQTHAYDNVADLGPFDPFFNDETTWKQRSTDWNLISRSSYVSFTQNLVNLASTGINLHNYSQELLVTSTNYAICMNKHDSYNENSFIEYQKGNLNQVFIYTALMQSLAAATFTSEKMSTAQNDQEITQTINNTNVIIKELSNISPKASEAEISIEELFQSEIICTIFNTSAFLPDSFTSLTSTMQYFIFSETNSMKKSLDIIEFLLPILFFIVCLLIMLPSLAFYIGEVKYFIKIIGKMSIPAKKAASEPILKIGNRMEITATESTYSTISVYGTMFFAIIILLIVYICEFLSFYKLKQTNLLFQYMQHWSADAGIRKTDVVEMLYWVLVRIIMEHPSYNNNYLYKVNVSDSYAKAWHQLKDSTAQLMSHTEESTVPLGYSTEIDQLILSQWCDPVDEKTFHDLYKCSSSQQLLSFYGASLSDIMLNPELEFGNTTNYPTSEVMLDVPHMIGVHILPLLIKIDDAFYNLSTSTLQNLYGSFDAYLLVEILSILLSTFLFWRVKRILDSIYNVIIMIMRRVPPNHLLSDRNILAYLLNKKKANVQVDMTTDQRIVHSSKDAIVCIDIKGIIDIVNPAVSNLVGFTPEQLLGQPILTFIAPDDRLKLETQLQMMANKQCSSIYEGHINCVNDEDTLVDCSITILTISNERNNEDSFVIILSDESSLIQQQEVAEEAKKQSETLLYQILPRGIVNRINQGEKDISFSVPCATIMFVDIVKFSDYSSMLSAQDIMNNLSLIFGSFDNSISKYNLLIKIKLIGDVYMCAGGIFTPDEHPSSHAVQMAQFGLEVLQNMEDVNMKLNSVLNVRIGMNTGGPLIAGVLGSDKPTFDIIGDPINVASRLQSTDLPGNIQISQSSFEYLQGNDFQIEPRGEIMLKGKGKTLTYLLIPFKVSINSELNYQPVAIPNPNAYH
ncbi:hypothetical protein TRFO_38870 [Tritrichomonas foetus]|uniref:Adenylate and Guanylate cyclase catalytic domain containing protein n=1 Tax=Tritrichomonas foetus TaxID=1144522 RepID=A0A1J4J6T7_9EUKA|nr:hypothetical protein TRFO_38870 [Tritrichomonas foetus]|eukprot:OHS94946.1 hypothetical protein TRFO_38870 [Tritrichomonas foetus]